MNSVRPEGLLSTLPRFAIVIGGISYKDNFVIQGESIMRS